MNETTTVPTVGPTNSGKMLQAMVGIGVLCALLIVLTYEGTFDRIEQNKAEALEQAIFKVLPGTATTQAFQLTDQQEFQVLGSDEKGDQVVYAGYDETGELTGVAIEASGQGYADILRILYGYDPAQEVVVGFYVLESKETPGLGDKIGKDANFLANFETLDVALNDAKDALKNTVVSVKSGTKENAWEIDAITGATISSRAIGDILGESTAYWVPLIYQNQTALTTEKTVE